MLPWYATEEQVARALDSKETARNRVQIERAVAAASRSVDGDLRRRFYPEVATYTFPRPQGCGRVLFLDSHLDVDLVELGTVTVAGTAVATTDRDLLPIDGPPFTRIEFGTSVSYGSGRRPIEFADSTWGYDNRTTPAGQLAAAIADTTTTTAEVTDSSQIGTGSLLTVGTERMVVTARSMLDTGQTLAADLDSSMSATKARVSDGGAFHVGEVLLVNSERLLVVDITGDDLIVKRAWDGTILGAGGGVGGAHATGAALFALRRLTVERGALGTTAATHLVDAVVLRQVYPGPVVAYTVALAVTELLGEQSGYGREIAVSGSETQIGGRGLDQIRDDARRSYRRMLLG